MSKPLAPQNLVVNVPAALRLFVRQPLLWLGAGLLAGLPTVLIATWMICRNPPHEPPKLLPVDYALQFIAMGLTACLVVGLFRAAEAAVLGSGARLQDMLAGLRGSAAAFPLGVGASIAYSALSRVTAGEGGFPEAAVPIAISLLVSPPFLFVIPWIALGVRNPVLAVQRSATFLGPRYPKALLLTVLSRLADVLAGLLVGIMLLPIMASPAGEAAGPITALMFMSLTLAISLALSTLLVAVSFQAHLDARQIARLRAVG
jgi:hypothetical protein